VIDLAEELARRFYEAKRELEFRRISYSKTQLIPGLWKDCSARERLELVEAAKRVLADKEIAQMLMNRAAGL
jgi:hypothetical protein